VTARRLVIAPVLWLILIGISVAVIVQTRFTADMSAFLPAHPTAEQAFLVEQLKGGAVSRMILMGIEGGTLKQRAALSQQLGSTLRQTGLFSAVRNGDAATAEADRKLLFRYRYLLSPTVTRKRFSATGLHQAISDSIDLLSSPLGMLTKKLLTRDPTGETLSLLESYGGGAGSDAPSSNGNGPKTRDGVWVSPDDQRTLLMAQTRADGSDTDAMQTAIERIRTVFAKLHKQHDSGGPDLKLLITGAPVFSVESRATIKSDVKRFSIISSVAIMLLLLLIYRSVPMLALGLLPVLSGVLVAIATVSLGFGTVHGITIGFGTTLIGESIDYSIYYFIQSQGDRKEGIERFWPTIRLGVLTSITGFAALLFSGFPGLEQIGLYSIAGLITAALVTRFVLPHLGTARFNQHSLVGLGRRLASILPRLPALRAPLIVLAIAGLGLLLWRHDGIWQTGLSGLSPIPEEAKALDERLSHDMGAPDARYFVVVHGDDREETLDAAEQAGQALTPLVTRHVLTGFDSPTRFLPSDATQRARQAALPDRSTLESNLKQALHGLPIRADKLQPFVDAVEQARQLPLLTPADLSGTSFGLAMSTLLQQRDGHWMALLPLHVAATQAEQPNEVARQVRHALNQPQLQQPHQKALFIDMLGESNRLYDGYLDNTITLSLLGLLGIVILLSLALRSFRRLWRVLMPLAMAIILVMAGLNLAGEKLTLLHLVGLLLIVAVGSNYALFFNQGHSPDPQTLASLVLANLTTVIAFGTLAFSQLPILHAFGSTVAPGAVLALLLSAIFARPTDSATPESDHAPDHA